VNPRATNYLLIAVCAVLIMLLYRSCQKAGRYEGVIAEQDDSLRMHRDQFGRWTTERSVIVGQYEEVKKLLVRKDSTLKELSQRLDKATISLTILKTKTQSTASSPTTIVIRDSILVPDTCADFLPEYRSSFSDRWRSYSVRATGDSIYVDYTSFNSFSIKQRWERQGLFKPKAIMLEVVNDNPYTSTIDTQSFLIPVKKERRLAWLAGAFFAGMLTGVVVLNR
jgi:hypothetical protein